MNKIEDIIQDMFDLTDKLDTLMSGQSVEANYLIERTVGNIDDIRRYELPEIIKALKWQPI